MITELISDKGLLYKVNKHHGKLFTMFSFFKVYLLLLVIIIQSIVTIGLVTEISIPKCQSLFFKLIELTQLSQKNLWKPPLNALCFMHKST